MFSGDGDQTRIVKRMYQAAATSKQSAYKAASQGAYYSPVVHNFKVTSLKVFHF
jgi:hypothetical protein